MPATRASTTIPASTPMEWRGETSCVTTITPWLSRLWLGLPRAVMHIVELAEISWQHIAHKRGLRELPGGQRIAPSDPMDPTEALVEAVLSIGGGERFSPTRCS